MTKRLTIALVALAMFVLVAAMPVSAYNNGFYYVVRQNINQGATVFIGEQGLDITLAMSTANAGTALTTIGWWASAADIYNTAPTTSVDTATRQESFTVTQAEFDGYEGQWYLVDPALDNTAKRDAGAVFNVKAPKIDVSIRDVNQNNADVSNKAIPTGAELQFQIGTNMYTVLSDQRTSKPTPEGFAASDGYINILVKPASGAVLGALYTCGEYDVDTGACIDTGPAVPIRMLAVGTQPYTWGINNVDAVWWTDARTGPFDTGQKIYPPGTYVVSAESKLNNMYDNYQSGSAAYTGRTVSETKTITLVSDTVSITANKDTVVRSKPFSVTITGKPTTLYNVWVKSTNDMALDVYDNAPPIVTKYQVLVRDGHPVTEEYLFQNGGGNKDVGDVAFGGEMDGDVCGPIDPYSTAGDQYQNCYYSYAQITTSTSGTRTVEFSTTANTKAQKFTIRVERNDNDNDYDDGVFKGDEVDVKVEKGAVTIVAAGDQSYYLGEEIKFSGTNTESTTTYLFIIGPNLCDDGAELNAPRECVENMDIEDFARADVLADNTWSYKWGTATIPLDAGTYTIYAVSQPVNRAQNQPDDEPSIATTAYGTVSIIIKKPFVSATASQSTVAKGDRIYLTGTAEGQPAEGVAIWIMGKNYAFRSTETVNSDSSFKFEITQQMTRDLYSGQYFVVVQHPMANGEFDIELANADEGWNQPPNGRLVGPDMIYVVNQLLYDPGMEGSLFLINGPGSLQGSDAAEALVQAINDPNVDDTYTKLQFLVEEPQIVIVPIGNKNVGDKFTITASTNLAVDDEILVQVYSSSFKPTQKSQSGEFSGATGTVKVTKGDLGMNKITFDVDAATFKPDEYIVTESAVIQDATGTALFNVLEAAPPTPVPTAAPTAVPTVATTVPTTVPPTPVPTPTKSPGYGALIALIGLGAVAFIVVRRH